MVLPTDQPDTILNVLDCLRKQSIASDLEVILATDSPDSFNTLRESMEGVFHTIQLIKVPNLSPLGVPRAAAVRIASADLVFIGETHSFAQPGWAEAIIHAFSDPRWDAVACGMGNANPRSRISWASYLGDYSIWSKNLPSSEIAETPLYNATYRRTLLRSIDRQLDVALNHGDELRNTLSKTGARAWLASDAVVNHANIDTPINLIREKYLLGLLIATQRAKRWGWGKRFTYALASPLIPFVLLSRLHRGYVCSLQSDKIPFGTTPMLVVSKFVQAFGEFIGYLGGGTKANQLSMDTMEIRKLDFVTFAIDQFSQDN